MVMAPTRFFALLGVSCAFLWTGMPVRGDASGDPGAWPAAVAGFLPPAPGEHPRLFFRKADLTKLRARARTPEGTAILARLKVLLGGGEAMPSQYSTAKRFNDKTGRLDAGAYTLSHAAGFGMLYQLTGEKKYADLGRQCVEKAFDGVRDSDGRYAWVRPAEMMRAGPSLGYIAMGYDLCYDGWDAEFRKKVAQAFMGYEQTADKQDGQITFTRLCLQPYSPAKGSNHYPLQVGGAAIACLALRADPELSAEQNATIDTYLATIEKNTLRVLTEYFGDGGYFEEHDGPGVISSTQSFIPALQAWRVAGGKDFVSPRPNAQWLTMKWVLELTTRDGKPVYPNHFPNGTLSYGDEFFERYGGHFEGHFAHGFGAILPEQVPALLWTYKTFVEPTEKDIPAFPFETNKLKPGEKSYDATLYPYRAVAAFVNWPIGIEPRNPQGIVPNVLEDKIHRHYVFRNRWQNERDCIVALLLGARTRDRTGGRNARLKIWCLGEQVNVPSVPPSASATLDGRKDGSGTVTWDGGALAIDYSRRSGAEAVVLLAGPSASDVKLGGKGRLTAVNAGERPVSVFTFTESSHPEVQVDGHTIKVGGAAYAFDGKAFTLPR